MRTFNTALLFLMCAGLAPAYATNYTNSGNSQSYNLYSGDTLRIVNNTYNGNINTFQNGAVIIVTAGSTFKPALVNTPAGKIINYGVCLFASAGTHGGFEFDNYGLLNVANSLSLYDGARQTWTNNIAATITIGGALSMSNALFTNYSSVSIGTNMDMYTATSLVRNYGSLTIGQNLNMSNGVLHNENSIRMQNLNAWGGEVNNSGELVPEGDMVFSNGTSYTNNCLLVTARGFTNYGNFTNNGLLWVGRTGTAADHFYNSGTFTNGDGAVVRAVRLTSYTALDGGGSYYITGESLVSGRVGSFNHTTDTIRVYDLSRAVAAQIFDVQWASVAPNVVYRPFAQPDTNEVAYGGCSARFRSDLGSPLPIEWNYFDAKPIQNKPVLTWSAQYEANMTFEVEKSTNNEHFTTIASTTSNNTAKYSYTDETAEKGTVVYYRIKGTSAMGAIKYTETKTVKIPGNNSAAVAVYPNPTRDVATIRYKSEKSEQVMVRVSNASGQQLLVKNVMAVKGSNAFSLSEAAQLKGGIYFVEIINYNGIVAAGRFIKN